MAWCGTDKIPENCLNVRHWNVILSFRNNAAIIEHFHLFLDTITLPAIKSQSSYLSNRDHLKQHWDEYRAKQNIHTIYPKKYAHGFCFAVLCCGYTLTDFPISIRLTSLALWQSNDCPSASKATLMNMDKYFMWIHYERLHNHNKAKHNKTLCIFLGFTV